MSLPSDWCIGGECLEWYTELPFHNRPRESPVFLIQNTECYFEFKRKDLTYYLYLKPKMTSIQLKSFQLIIYSDHIGTTSGGIFSRCIANVDDLNRCVHEFKDSCFAKRGQNLYQGLFIRFCFIFKNGDGSSLSLGKRNADKSIQTGSYLSANVSLGSLSGDFFKVLDSSLNHDAEIKCGGHSLKAHKIVLSARSEVFKAMMQSDMQEARTGVIEIQDMDVNYFQDFIEFLYTGIMRELTFDKVKTLYKVGDKYAVRSLVNQCSDYLQDILSRENVFESFTLADAHSDKKLQDRIITYILEQKIYLQREFWEPFCESFPKVAIDVYKLSYKNNMEE